MPVKTASFSLMNALFRVQHTLLPWLESLLAVPPESRSSRESRRGRMKRPWPVPDPRVTLERLEQMRSFLEELIRVAETRPGAPEAALRAMTIPGFTAPEPMARSLYGMLRGHSYYDVLVYILSETLALLVSPPVSEDTRAPDFKRLLESTLGHLTADTPR